MQGCCIIFHFKTVGLQSKKTQNCYLKLIITLNKAITIEKLIAVNIFLPGAISDSQSWEIF